MKLISNLKLPAILLLLMCISNPYFSQKKIASPRDSVSGKIGSAVVSLNYGSPSVKGRKIWGDLVPYKEVWRAGANEATVFTCSKAVKIDGKDLPAGTYGFFAIPGETEWTIIFNKTAKQWGAYDYDAKQDVLRVTIKPKKSAAMQERLVYKINGNGVSLIWENLELAIPVK